MLKFPRNIKRFSSWQDLKCFTPFSCQSTLHEMGNSLGLIRVRTCLGEKNFIEMTNFKLFGVRDHVYIVPGARTVLIS